MKKLLAHSYIYLILLMLYAPLFILIVFSFTETRVLGAWTGFSLEPFKDVFMGVEAPKIRKAVLNTIIVALVSSSFSTFIGSLAAIGVFSMKKLSRKVISNVNQLPIINAEIVSAVALMTFFSMIPFIRPGWTTLILGHISFCTPYVFLSVMPKLQSLDPNVYEAALDLGANPTKALFKVLLPMLKTAIVAGFLLSFTLSLDDFVITIFNNGSVETLSTYIWNNSIKKGIAPSTKALSTLLFVFIMVVLIIINVFKSKQNQTKKEIVEK